jgi:hypothetical protein
MRGCKIENLSSSPARWQGLKQAGRRRAGDMRRMTDTGPLFNNMKKETMIKYLNKLITLKKLETEVGKLKRELENNISLPLKKIVGERIVQIGQELGTAYNNLQKAYKEWKKVKCEEVESIYQKAIEQGIIALKMGHGYSGITERKLLWGEKTDAYTFTTEGEAYAYPKNKYNKTDAEHVVTLNCEEIINLYLSGIPPYDRNERKIYIGRNSEGKYLWVVRYGQKAIALKSGFVAFYEKDNVTEVAFSEKSQAHADKKLAIKVKRKLEFLKKLEENRGIGLMLIPDETKNLPSPTIINEQQNKENQLLTT